MDAAATALGLQLGFNAHLRAVAQLLPRSGEPPHDGEPRHQRVATAWSKLTCSQSSPQSHAP